MGCVDKDWDRIIWFYFVDVFYNIFYMGFVYFLFVFVFSFIYFIKLIIWGWKINMLFIILYIWKWDIYLSSWSFEF